MAVLSDSRTDCSGIGKGIDFTQLYSTVEELHARHAGMRLDRASPVHLVHVINPVHAPPGHSLERPQTITYDSMRRAAAYSAHLDSAVRIDFVAAPLPEDVQAVPEGFIRLPELTRTSSDVANFQVPRRLPLLYEILQQGHDFAASLDTNPSPHLILTNVDIGIMPHFYAYAAWLIRSGHDVAIINRRTIQDHYCGLEDLPAMLSDFGCIHPGLDCFIFESEIIEHFIPFNTVIGMPHVMRPLFFNLMAFARNPVVLTNAHATFHLGDDQATRIDKYADYDQFNRRECLNVIEALCQRDQALEARLTAFVHATEEHLWIPEGILGVQRSRNPEPLSARIRRRLIRILEAGI